MPPTQTDTLRNLPPYVFAELDRLKAEARARGATLVDLGIGSPNLPVAPGIIRAMAAAGEEPTSGAYPPFRGTPGYFDAITDFMHARFGATIEPETEALALSGAKEGIAQLVFALCEPRDVVLVPEIYYPVYARASLLAGAEVHFVPMRASSGFLVDFDAVPASVLRRARILIVNYPNNPTGAVAEREYFERAVAFARQHGLILISDLAYSQITFDGFVAPSALEIPGAKDVTIEFHSCSKSFNMAGVRVGFAVGAAALIDALAAYRTNVGYGAPSVVQYGAAHAFDNYAELSAPVAATYRARRDAITSVMRRLGARADPPRGAMYLWRRVPDGVDGWTFVRAMLDDARVVVTPGSAFGPGGTGYFRLSYVAEPHVLESAMERIGTARAARGWR